MRFVSPETVRIDLKDTVTLEPVTVATLPGDPVTREVREKNWILIKNELSIGEDREYRAAGFGKMSQRAATPGQPEGVVENEFAIDWKKMALAKLEAYLVDWSAKVPINRDSIAQLATDDFEEIAEAIDKHIAAKDAEKKQKPGPRTSTPPSR